MVTAPIGHDGKPLVLEVRLLGRFAVAAGGRTAGPWPRPSARRLCQLLLVSPGRRLSRDGACDALFPSLAPGPAAHALYKAQSMARSVLLPLGPKAGGLLRSDRAQLWFSTDIILHVDLDGHEQALRSALRASPGLDRDTAIIHALATDGVLLEDEPDAEWACRVRERLEYVRQEARLELARDRARGIGRCHPEQVMQAWQAAIEGDPACEEAVSALMRLYLGQGRRSLAVTVYERCRQTLGSLGLTTSLALDEVRANLEGPSTPEGRGSQFAADQAAIGPDEERRLVTVAFVELSPAGLHPEDDPEDLRELIGRGLARAISEAEALGGTIASISGPGLWCSSGHRKPTKTTQSERCALFYV